MPGTGFALTNVTKIYIANGEPVIALDDVSLSMERGTFTALLGPSGCGKSTMLRILADLEDASEGEVLIHGETPAAARAAHLLGMAMQDPSLLPWRTVTGNIALPGQVMRDPTPRDRIDSLLDITGLTDFRDAQPTQLSGGMRQRAAIARTLAPEPEVILLDEPFGALDEITRQHMNEQLQALWSRTSATAVLVTHSIAEAAFLSDSVVVMSPRPGRIVDTIEIDFPRPRGRELLSDPRFHAVCDRLADALHAGGDSEVDEVAA